MCTDPGIIRWRQLDNPSPVQTVPEHFLIGSLSRSQLHRMGDRGKHIERELDKCKAYFDPTVDILHRPPPSPWGITLLSLKRPTLFRL